MVFAPVYYIYDHNDVWPHFLFVRYLLMIVFLLIIVQWKYLLSALLVHYSGVPFFYYFSNSSLDPLRNMCKNEMERTQTLLVCVQQQIRFLMAESVSTEKKSQTCCEFNNILHYYMFIFWGTKSEHTAHTTNLTKFLRTTRWPVLASSNRNHFLFKFSSRGISPMHTLDYSCWNT